MNQNLTESILQDDPDMQDFPINSITPEIDLGSTTLSNLNDPDIILNLHNAIYLKKFPYTNSKIDTETIILFLGSLNSSDFDFNLKTGLNRVKDSNILDCRIYIFDKASQKKIFKVSFDSLGNVFYIQIMGTSEKVQYEIVETRFNVRDTPTFKYIYHFNVNLLNNNPYHIDFPFIIHKLSVLFNRKDSDPNTNEFTAILFQRISPFHKKTISRNLQQKLNPTNDIYDIFNKQGGYLFYVKGSGPFICKGEQIFMFAWFHPYMFDIINHSSVIGLDATFRVLRPFACCIPQLIFRNTGVPLGLLVGPHENSLLYSLFFQSILQIKPDLFKQLIENYCYITDEHKCFSKLKKIYGIHIYNCFTHLIRTIGANSPLAMLFREILYCSTEKEYEANLLRFNYIFMNLIQIAKEESQSLDKNNIKRFLKVGKVLGIDLDGSAIETEVSYSPLFNRIAYGIPTTNNYSESFHSKINSIAGDQRLTINNRLSLVANYIIRRLHNIEDSSIGNLEQYIRNLKKRALNKVSKNESVIGNYTKEKCNCNKSLYYSSLYQMDIPCIHMILNERWNDNIKLIKEQIKNNNALTLSKCAIRKLFTSELQSDYFAQEEDEETSEEEEIIEAPIDIGILTENKCYDDPIEKMIYRIHLQMKKIFSIDKIQVASFCISAQQEILTTKEGNQMLNENYDQFLAELQVKTWLKIYDAMESKDKK